MNQRFWTIELSKVHPAAIVKPTGEVVRSNDLYQNHVADVDVLEIFQSLHFSGQRSQVHVTPQGTLLKARLVYVDHQANPFDSAVMLLEWTPTSEAELRLAFFQIVSKAVNSSLIMDEIFDVLADEIQRFIPYLSGTIVILDDSQNVTKVVVRLSDQGTARIMGDIQEFVGYDSVMSELLHQPQSKVFLQAEYPKSVLIDVHPPQNLVVPLIAKGYVIGFISLAGEVFDAQSVNLLEDISEQLAVAVENARLYWRTQNQASREFLVNHITKAIRNSLQIDSILQTTVDEVGRVLGGSRCIIHYWGRFGQTFQYEIPGVAAIKDVSSLASFEYKLFSSRQSSPGQYNPFVLNDVRDYDQARSLFELNHIKSLAVCPILMSDGSFEGTLSIQQCDHYRAWLTEDIELLQAIAEHVSLALHQANLFLETEHQRQQLETMLQELQRTQMHLIQSEKMAVLGQFVAGIAHEVNTPLGTIMANEDTVLKCIETLSQPGLSMEEQDKYKGIAHELLGINRMATERIEEVVRNLRHFARLDESDMKAIDVHEGIEATLLLIRRSITDRLRVNKVYGNLPSVECFPGLLNQVFLNLLVNAIQSIEERQAQDPDFIGQITITTAYRPEAQSVVVSIQDNGKGIQPAHLNKIFDPGFTTKGVGVGTGLGLALCFQIMDKHQGHIEVDSVVGEGTRMDVVVPIKPPQAVSPMMLDNSETPSVVP